MSNFINTLNKWFTPTIPATKESLKDLQARTKELEQQAVYAETEAKLIDRSNKAKKRIKTAKRGNAKRLVYSLAGLVFIVTIILIISRSC